MSHHKSREVVLPIRMTSELHAALDAFAQVRKRYDIPEFDPENLPVAACEDWSWFMPDQTKSAMA